MILNYLISAFVIFITILISTFSCGLKNACSMSSYEEMNGLLHPREGRAPLPVPSFYGPEVLFGNQQTFPKWHHKPARCCSPFGCALRTGGGGIPGWTPALSCTARFRARGLGRPLSHGCPVHRTPPAAPAHRPCSLLPPGLCSHPALGSPLPAPAAGWAAPSPCLRICLLPLLVKGLVPQPSWDRLSNACVNPQNPPRREQ